jgi:hypothetical protein
MKGERVYVSGPDGSGYHFDAKSAKEFVKNNPGFSVGEPTQPPNAASESKAVQPDDVENKAVNTPQKVRR